MLALGGGPEQSDCAELLTEQMKPFAPTSDDIRHHVLTTNDVKQQRLEWHVESNAGIQ